MLTNLWNEKCFLIRCDKCNIEETMMFRSRLSKGRLRNKHEPKLPFFYKHIQLSTIDKNGNEIKNCFKPIKTIFGDQLPKSCPVCGAKLRASKLCILH